MEYLKKPANLEDQSPVYSDRIIDSLHRTHARIPASLVPVISQCPSLLSPAIHSLSHLDQDDIRICKAMKYFPPETCVLTDLLLTRSLYTQLLRQKYIPDPITGWDIPLQEDGTQYKQEYHIGCKLACGFEILAVRAEGATYDLETIRNEDVRWSSYMESLNARKYFKDYSKDSVEYSHLLKNATQYYNIYLASGSDQQLSAGKLLLHLLDETSCDMQALKSRQNSLPAIDDDSWLTEITPQNKRNSLIESVVITTDLQLTDSLRLFLAQASVHPHQTLNSERDRIRKLSQNRKMSRERKYSNRKVSGRKFSERKFSTDRRISSSQFSERKISTLSTLSAKLDISGDDIKPIDHILDCALFEDEWYSDSESSGMSSYDEDEDCAVELEESMKRPPAVAESETDSACCSRKSSTDGSTDN